MADDILTMQKAWRNSIQSGKRDTHGEAERYLSTRVATVYESKEAASGVVSAVNIRTIAGFTTLFDTVKLAYRAIIRTDAAITIRFNAVGNDPISIAANDSLDCDFLEIESIFVTAAGSANLKVILI